MSVKQIVSPVLPLTTMGVCLHTRDMPEEKKSEKIEKKEQTKNASKIIIGICLFLVLLATIFSYYFWNKYQKAQQLLKNPTIIAQIETQDLVAKVGKLIELPKDEQPTIATVSDVSKLKDQAFFKNAKNGYKVLIYAKAKKAILYDPIANKIVEVGPLNVVSPTNAIPSVTPSPKITPKVTVSPTKAK